MDNYENKNNINLPTKIIHTLQLRLAFQRQQTVCKIVYSKTIYPLSKFDCNYRLPIHNKQFQFNLLIFLL